MFLPLPTPPPRIKLLVGFFVGCLFGFFFSLIFFSWEVQFEGSFAPETGSGLRRDGEDGKLRWWEEAGGEGSAGPRAAGGAGARGTCRRCRLFVCSGNLNKRRNSDELSISPSPLPGYLIFGNFIRGDLLNFLRARPPLKSEPPRCRLVGESAFAVERKEKVRLDFGVIVLPRLPGRAPPTPPSPQAALWAGRREAAGQPSLFFVLFGAHAGIFGEGKAVIPPWLWRCGRGSGSPPPCACFLFCFSSFMRFFLRRGEEGGLRELSGFSELGQRKAEDGENFLGL